MASLTRVNGTTQPVFNLDVRNGSIAGTANIAAQGAVQPQGPKLDFFSLVANASLASAGNVNGMLNNAFQSIQSGGGIVDGGAGGTIAMYQVSPAAPTILNIAIYPTGAWSAAGLVAALEAGPAGSAWANAVTVTTEATFTN